ncbi:MAG: MBL fold metallo-hydrolase [Chlamydiota bacterium]
MQGFFPLASGSKGNALLIASKETRLLIDAGISTKRLRAALTQYGFSLEEIEGVVVTHEHHDHIAGLRLLQEKWGIPIFCNLSTAKEICHRFGGFPFKCKIFSTGEAFSYKDFSIDPFSISHDTLDPVALRVNVCNHTIGICTDLGFVSSLVERKLRLCDIVYLESNHDPELVQKSKRPSTYKVRVLGNQGHLSNASCANLLGKIYHPGMRAIYLAHLSSECNTHELAVNTTHSFLSNQGVDIPIIVAQQDEPSTPLFFANRGEKQNMIHAV